MTIIQELIAKMQKIVAVSTEYPAELFTEYRYVLGEDKCCHQKVVSLIKQAAAQIPGVLADQQEKELGKAPRWRPDVILRESNSGDVTAIVEYESLNSSDARVLEKDVAGYEAWIGLQRQTIPLLIVTTLPHFHASEYRLLYTNRKTSQYNADHAINDSEVRKNPFRYWYAYYRLWLEPHLNTESLPVSLANFSGNQLTLFDTWPVDAAQYLPALQDGADWSGAVGTTPESERLRQTYKQRLWVETAVPTMKELLKQFWREEQLANGPEPWHSPTERAFLKEVERVRNRAEACRLIEKLQWNMIPQK